MPFFFWIFHKKTSALRPIFRQKMSISKINALIPIFCQNNVNFLSKYIALMYFFQTSHEKPPAVITIFGQKMSILLKLHLKNQLFIF